jgi:hypothetical protein
MTSVDSFGAAADLRIGERTYRIYRLDAVAKAGVGDVATLPYSLRILLENLLRHEDGKTVSREDIAAVAGWNPTQRVEHEVQLRPARVLMQDFTGVPAVCDLAAMRDAFAKLGLAPDQINPLKPVHLVIDHSVQVDVYGTPQAFGKNVGLEFARNHERYVFLRWGQQAFDDMKVVPPGTGIVHQVNVEYLAGVVWTAADGDRTVAFPDSLVGTDSHTTMVNGLGVMGWGVGGIEAEAVMLGQPMAMLIPEVVGFELRGQLPPGATATDLVLTVTQLLRKKGVVDKFVEFYGDGIAALSLARPRDHRQHGARVRRDHGLLPDRSGDDRLPALHRPRSAPGRAGRALRQGELAVARPDRQAAVRRLAVPRSVDGRAVDRRPGAAPGSHAAVDLAHRLAQGVGALLGDKAAPGRRVPDLGRRWRGPGGRRSADRRVHRSRQLRPRPRRRRDRRDHELHQHLEPGGHAGRRPGRAEGPGPWPHHQAVGQDQPGARLAGRHRVLQGRRGPARPRGPGLPRRRLRLHDLHRQQRPSPRRHRPRGQGRRPGRHLGPVGQPQLRGPGQPGGPRQLPGVAAAGRGLRPGRHHEHRLRQPSRSATTPTASR